MTRMQQFENEVKEATKKYNRMRSTTPVFVDAEFCDNPHADWFFCRYFPVKIHKGLVREWIVSNGFSVCKKEESTCLLTVGEKTEGGVWKKGAKNFWLKPCTNAKA